MRSSNMILQGDVNDLEFRRRLIDNLVYKVYVSDDNTYIYFNIKGGKEIEEITFEDTIAALKEANRVQTQRDPARQKNPTLKSGVFHSMGGGDSLPVADAVRRPA